MSKYIINLLDEDFVTIREWLIKAKSLEHAKKKAPMILRGYKGTCYLSTMTLSDYGLRSFHENKIRRRKDK